MSYSKSKSWIDVENGPFSFIESDITNEVFIISDENDNPIDNFNQKWITIDPSEINIEAKVITGIEDSIDIIKNKIEIERKLNEYIQEYFKNSAVVSMKDK